MSEIAPYLTQKLAFDESKLWRGKAVQLITPVYDIGDSHRKFNALIKEISPFSITLVIGSISGDFEEKEIPVEGFSGNNPYRLQLLVPENEVLILFFS